RNAAKTISIISPEPKSKKSKCKALVFKNARAKVIKKAGLLFFCLSVCLLNYFCSTLFRMQINNICKRLIIMPPPPPLFIRN
ncbi:MAG: hypothetical protein L3J66_06030, partial [Bacteroidales bacterium]|nr:hypothetical protein [Bacteroidales bacterium]